MQVTLREFPGPVDVLQKVIEEMDHGINTVGGTNDDDLIPTGRGMDSKPGLDQTEEDAMPPKEDPWITPLNFDDPLGLVG